MKKIIIKIYCNLKLLLSPFKSKINIIKDDEMVDYIKKNGLSIIRFGDGEFRIIQSRKGIHYQDFDENLCKEMENLYYTYSNDSKYLLCVPHFFNENLMWFKKMPYGFTTCFAKCRLFFRKNYNRNMIYGDAFLFKKGNKKVFEKLWINEKKIILVHNNVKWAKLLEKEYDIKVDFIEIPSKNSYNKIDDIQSQIMKSGKDVKVLISGGPMAKALIYRLSKKGYIIYDTGHCFDEPLELNNEE